ncbi:MAG TPA: alkaline phosphatase family protein [Steroidobacteraceae bacterium]|nr:alkaline phosphatase family protein [Steroidobacteraceae bacterium]
MKWLLTLAQLILALLAAACSGSDSSTAPGTGTTTPAEGLNKVNHIIVVMLENHSFDNYFGALAYAPGGPYHASSVGCAADDHSCVDGLNCSVDPTRGLVCTNSNLDDDGAAVAAFHAPSRCTVPDLAHSWQQSHLEANFADPNAALFNSPNDGFVRVNDASDQPDDGVETPTDDGTMGFYTQDDLPFYYDLAEKFAIDDRYFASVMGPTLANRLFEVAATSFGHVSAADPLPSGGVFKPISGTIFDLLDSKGISWTDYSEVGLPEAMLFRLPTSATDPHFGSLPDFLAAAAGSSGTVPLPQVSWVDAGFTDNEHPPDDIQLGQVFVSRIVNAIRSGPYWKDSVIFITYDEHGGFYDHVAPPPAPQGGARTPDDIPPGQCADLSNPPASKQPGAGVDCGGSAADVQSLCPALAQSPTGQYPDDCASFDQLGFRVPFIIVSPFARAHYVSHTIADHASLLAFIEERFLNGDATVSGRLHLTRRDQYADTLEDAFDFDNAPSLNTPVTAAQPPTADCSPP